MRTVISILTLAAAICPPDMTLAQTADETVAFSRSLSEAAGVPLGTVLTDIVTKAAPGSIKSNLQTVPSSELAPDFGLPNTTARSEALSLNPVIGAQIRDALNRGYIVRDVELDPRFEANVRRISGQVALEKIRLRSPRPEGLTIALVERPKAIVDMAMPFDVAPTPPTVRSAEVGEQNSNERVWGGAAIPAGTDPFRASVAILGNNKICSGTLVANDTVITAGHCYCGGVMEEVLVGTSIISPSERVKVVKENSEVFRQCSDVSRDPSVGDIALLKLERPVSPAPHPVGTLSMVKDSAAIRAVGFGRTESSIGFKYQVNVVIASYQCDGSGAMGLPDQQVYRCRPAHELVAAGLNRDTCGGDSGGSAFVFGPDTRVYLVGVTSRAIHPSGKCGPGGIYVLLGAPPIREWLEARGVTFN